MPKPGAPTVTPNIAAGGTATGIVINSPTGSSTYSYEIVARDKYGALTAAGTATTITTGHASLGLRTATITTALRSKDSVTVNTSVESMLVVGALIHITGSSNPDFDGWFMSKHRQYQKSIRYNGNVHRQSWNWLEVRRFRILIWREYILLSEQSLKMDTYNRGLGILHLRRAPR